MTPFELGKLLAEKRAEDPLPSQDYQTVLSGPTDFNRPDVQRYMALVNKQYYEPKNPVHNARYQASKLLDADSPAEGRKLWQDYVKSHPVYDNFEEPKRGYGFSGLLTGPGLYESELAVSRAKAQQAQQQAQQQAAQAGQAPVQIPDAQRTEAFRGLLNRAKNTYNEANQRLMQQALQQNPQMAAGVAQAQQMEAAAKAKQTAAPKTPAASPPAAPKTPTAPETIAASPPAAPQTPAAPIAAPSTGKTNYGDYLKNPYVLGGLGVGALGLGGYGLYRYLNSRKKKKQQEKEAAMTSFELGMLTAQRQMTKEARNLNLGAVPKGAGPENMYNALNMLSQARTLVNPENTLETHGLKRRHFDAMIDRLAEEQGDSYDFDALRQNPKNQAILKGLGGAALGGLAGYLGGGNALSAVGGAGLGAGLGSGYGYLSAGSHNDKLLRTAKVLREYGLLKPDYLRSALPLLKESGQRGLWDNIHAKRERGEKPAKPGDEDYPDKKSWNKTVKESWEYGADDGSYSNDPLAYAAQLTAPPETELSDEPEKYRKFVSQTLQDAVQSLPAREKLHWREHGLFDRSAYNPLRYLMGKQYLGEKHYSLGRDSDEKTRNEIIQKIVDNNSYLNDLMAYQPKNAGDAWQKAEGKNPDGGLNAKGRASLKAEGQDIKPPVTEDKPTGERAGRKASFCARMGGMKKKLTSSETANDPDSRINKALRKWNC